MTDIELLDGTKVVLQNPDDDPYESLTVGITVLSEDVLGKRLTSESEAEAFSYLTNKFFVSEFVYEQFKVFCKMHFDKALAEVKSRTPNSPLV